MNDKLPGDDLLEELDELDELEDIEETTPGEEPTTDEKRADRVISILFGGIPLFLLGLLTTTAGIATWRPLVIGVGAVAAFLGFIVYAASYVPPGVVLWRRLLIKSAANYREATSADALGFVFRGSGQLDPRAVKYLGSDTNDQQAKWATKSTGEKWGAGTEGSSVNLLGEAPVVFFDEDDPDRVTAKYGRMAEAIDLGQERPLYTNAQIDEVVYEQQIYPPGTEPPAADAEGADGEIAADGGAAVQPSETRVVDREYRVRNNGKIIDSIVDLSSPGDCSGGRVSFEKAKELRDETATTEEMKRQEDRGRIAELKRGADRKFVLKVLLIAAAIIGIIYLGPMLIEGLFGGGGGGSSVVPLSMAQFPSLGGL